jgi:hypothetical protein
LKARDVFGGISVKKLPVWKISLKMVLLKEHIDRKRPIIKEN